MNAREEIGVSRSALARVTGVGVSTISGWERGENEPTVDRLWMVWERVARELAPNAEEVQIREETDRFMALVIPIPAQERDLADWRGIRGMLQPTLAGDLEISTMSLSNLERGVSPLQDSLVPRLAESLRLTEAEVRAAYSRARDRPLLI
ncbi:helix-turn-helix transcriptional regulator [Skermania sp. ID1734]|uniref:helix-turn-helix domain-containing protein n=1 Tax=Skermania sp. ID1734 TaxID=2597516 RepID=UPI002104EAF5|nr:helix-turn-helix transcriptional regulator [Skermania sp. ID1734]